MAANAQGRGPPLSHLARGAQLPHSPPRHKAQAPGRQQDCGLSNWGGGSWGYRERSPASVWLPTTPGSGVYPFAWLGLAFPLCKVGTADSVHHLPHPSPGPGESAPHLNTVQMWKQGEGRRKMRASGGTNTEGALLGVYSYLNHHSWP